MIFNFINFGLNAYLFTIFRWLGHFCKVSNWLLDLLFINLFGIFVLLCDFGQGLSLCYFSASRPELRDFWLYQNKVPFIWISGYKTEMCDLANFKFFRPKGYFVSLIWAKRMILCDLNFCSFRLRETFWIYSSFHLFGQIRKMARLRFSPFVF